MANRVATAIDGLLCYCRAGFEPELAAELGHRAAVEQRSGYAKAARGSGYVLFVSEDGDGLNHALSWRELIFARQKLRLIAELQALDPKDRITPILDALNTPETIARLGESRFGKSGFGELVVEHPDSDEGKPLAGLARSFGNALRPALRKAGLLSKTDNPKLARLHIFFGAGDHAFVASSQPDDSASWPLGIPRLRMHADAPSRSALKLEEAFLTLLTVDERERLLQPGMRAADLGAAPGGWTWVLTRHGLRVIAIDNGPLREHVMQSGLVEHQRADGFSWQPKQPLDWLVCDMVEQPRRVAERMATWFREGWCRHAVFNLKLPMKKRWDETQRCLGDFLEQSDRTLHVRAKQLYHDREEITVFATIATRF